MNRNRRTSRNHGFTLIESALTTVIVATGVMAMMAAQQAYLRKNDWAQRTGTAVLLANELREATLDMPLNDPFEPGNMGPETGEGRAVVGGVGQYTFDDVDDFAGVVDPTGFGAGTVFDPPLNALLEEIDGIDGWSQLIMVENVLEDNHQRDDHSAAGNDRPDAGDRDRAVSGAWCCPAHGRNPVDMAGGRPRRIGDPQVVAEYRRRHRRT